MTKKRSKIDSVVACYIAEIVEHMTKLEHHVSLMRWRMLRGEEDEMWVALDGAKTAVNHLKQELAGLYYSLDCSRKEAAAEKAQGEEVKPN